MYFKKKSLLILKNHLNSIFFKKYMIVKFLILKLLIIKYLNSFLKEI